MLKTYIIAEIGINHNGSLANCLKMIDAASAAGCDAVKVQFFRAGKLYPKSAGRLDWKDSNGEYSYDIYSAVEAFELPEAWLDELIRHSAAGRIDLVASVFDEQGCDFLVKKGLKSIKLSSYTITNIPLIERCASTGLPLIMSCGGAMLGEVQEAVGSVLKYHNRLSLLHCSINYPTELRDCNLGVIETLRLAFPDIAVGYSDHTKEISDAPVQAVYLGAGTIEKHITLDKKMAGPDHFFALQPEELTRMVSDVRQAEAARDNGECRIDRVLYGNTARVTYPGKKYLRDFAYMKMFAARDIRAGERIVPGDISILRPGRKAHGLDPKYVGLFREYVITAKKDIHFEEPITWDSVLS